MRKLSCSDTRDEENNPDLKAVTPAPVQPGPLADVAELAAVGCQAPFGAVLVRAAGRLFTVATFGFGDEVLATSRDPLALLCRDGLPFFHSAIDLERPIEIGPGREIPPLPVRACAAEAIRSSEGALLGALLVADRDPRPFDLRDRRSLAVAARRAADIIVAGEGGERGLSDTAAHAAGAPPLDEQLQHLAVAGQIASGIAHDVCNFLTAILAGAEVIQQRVPPGTPLAAYAANAAGAAHAAGALLRRLIAVARPDPSPPVVLDLNRAIEQRLATIAAAVGRGVELRLELTGGGAPVRLRKTDLDRLLLNLAMNARQAMGDRGTITIRTLRYLPGPHAAAGARGGSMLEVQDTGHGIAPEHRARIFEPYFTTRAQTGGTGLGLALVHNVVAEAGATIDVDSQLGEGARFRIRFPPADTPVEGPEVA
jgi:signal transduction histidine kinase